MKKSVTIIVTIFMKISLVICFISINIFTALCASTSSGQNLDTRVSAHFKNGETLENAVEYLRNATKVKFSYDPKAIQQISLADYQFANQPLGQVLDIILLKTGIKYTQQKETVVLFKNVPSAEGIIEGIIYDVKSKETLPEAVITVNNRSYSADAGGHYHISLPAGTYDLEAGYIGYKSQKIPGVIVKEKVTTPLNVFLELSSTQLNEVSVQAHRKVNTRSSLLDVRKNSAIVTDGISAEDIEKTASITTTQALQRVSGVTVTDGKYVAIRGLGDRSVIAELNGVRLASSDPDRSSIPLDLIPASLLDNITVYKTATPDNPADAAAGIIELKTKSVPDSEILNITVQSGFNSNVGIGGQVNGFYNDNLGAFGQNIAKKDLPSNFTNLANEYPGGNAQMQQIIADSKNSPALAQEAGQINSIMHQFDPVLTTTYQNAHPNQVYSISYGNSYKVFGKHELGVVAGANYYSRTDDIYNGTVTDYSIRQGVVTGNPQIFSPRLIPPYITPNNLNLGQYVTFKENTGTQTLNYGFLGGLTYRFNQLNQISVQYVGSRGAEDEGQNLNGKFNYVALPGTINDISYTLRQTYRTLNTFNLQGEDKLWNGKNGIKIDYNLATSNSEQNEPDYRTVNLIDYHLPSPEPVPVSGYPGSTQSTSPATTNNYYSLLSGYANGIGPYGKIQVDPNGRYYRDLNETNHNYKIDASVPFTLLGQQQLLKFGFNYLHRDRTYTENQLSLPGSNFSADGADPLYAVNGNLDQLVGYNKVGILPPTNAEGSPAVGGFLYNALKSPNNYTGFYETRALYAMGDFKLMENLRLTGGVRFESTNIQSLVDTSNVFIDPSLKSGAVNLVLVNPKTVYKTGYKPYYSLNLTYIFHKDMNFRFAYSTALARPELRELTNVYTYDPVQQAVVVGNPNLKNQYNQNADFRWEWFPNEGEVFSASAFYKRITNQLTKTYSLNSQGDLSQYPEFPVVQYINDPDIGKVYGVELEADKNLGTIWDPLRYFSLGSNLMLAQSSIEKNPERLNDDRTIDRQSSATSPLFEQAPYSINASLDYDNPRAGTDVTMSFNEVGERLIQVNLTGEPDLYTRPVPVLDLVFSQRITKKLMMKGFAKNIINKPYQEVYADPGTGGQYYGKTYVHRSYYYGSEFMLGFTYNLF
jgi:TonB-dependent receptor